MAVTVTQLGPGTLRKIRDADTSATLEANVATGAATLHSAFIDNTLNTSAVYVKLYNATTATVGTTVPFLVIPVPASKSLPVNFLGGGLPFSVAISFAGVTTGGTGGVTSPVSDVIVELVVR